MELFFSLFIYYYYKRLSLSSSRLDMIKNSRVYSQHKMQHNTGECNQIIHAHISKFVIIFSLSSLLFLPYILYDVFFPLFWACPVASFSFSSQQASKPARERAYETRLLLHFAFFLYIF